MAALKYFRLDHNRAKQVIKTLEKMKATFDVLGVFALVVCISQSAANNVEASDPANDLVSIQDLPFELLLDIFMQLDLKNVISISKTHPHNREVADDMMRRLLLNQTLKISGSSYTIGNRNYFGTSVNFQTILDLFKYFGHHITKLNVRFGQNSFQNQKQLETLNEYISKYGAISLREIDFNSQYFVTENPIINLNGPFPNVEVVHLKNGKIQTKANLSEIFPSVRSLNVETMILFKENLAQPFRSLEHLTIPKDSGIYSSEFPSIEQTLQLNPQLKHLSIFKCGWKFLQLVNHNRPDLESLKISFFLGFFDYGNVAAPIRFINMKKLTFLMYPLVDLGNSDPIPLEFGNLEEIEFDHMDSMNHWIDIVLQNRNLKKMFTRNVMHIHNLERITNGLPNLEEFTMKRNIGDRFSTQETIDFMQRTNQLKRVTLLYLDINDCQTLAQQLNNQWESVKINSDVCSFVRM